MALGTKRKATQRLSVNPVSLPSGAIQAFAGSVAPEGWAICNGDEISRTDYASLYNAIGNSWGEGDGSSTFNLPDLRGRFLRGVDNGAGRDPDAISRQDKNGSIVGDVVGSIQDDKTRRPRDNAFTGSTGLGGAHTHDLKVRVRAIDGSGSEGDRTVQDNQPFGSNYISTAPNHSHSATITGGGDAETRPINANVNYIIKL